MVRVLRGLVGKIPHFIRINDTYHNSFLVRNVMEFTKDDQKWVKLSLHGETKERFFTIVDVSEDQMSPSLKAFLSEIKSDDN